MHSIEPECIRSRQVKALAIKQRDKKERREGKGKDERKRTTNVKWKENVFIRLRNAALP